jgi:hypothetical protein
VTYFAPASIDFGPGVTPLSYQLPDFSLPNAVMPADAVLAAVRSEYLPAENRGLCCCQCQNAY